jgi:hypothetical protein
MSNRSEGQQRSRLGGPLPYSISAIGPQQAYRRHSGKSVCYSTYSVLVIKFCHYPQLYCTVAETEGTSEALWNERGLSVLPGLQEARDLIERSGSEVVGVSYTVVARQLDSSNRPGRPGSGSPTVLKNCPFYLR